MNLGNWYHVVLSRNSSVGGRIYINGVPQGSLVGLGNLAVNNAPLNIGAGGSSNQFPGSIDEVRIYNRSLSDKEVQYLYKYG